MPGSWPATHGEGTSSAESERISSVRKPDAVRAELTPGEFRQGGATEGSSPARLAASDGTQSGDSYHLQSDAVLADGAWHYEVFAIDRQTDTSALYVDAVGLDTRTDVDSTLGTSYGAPFRIGTNWNNSEPFAGALDEVRVRAGIPSIDWIDAQNAAMRDRLATYTPL